MTAGTILILAAIIILIVAFYGVFCYAPSEESRNENVDRCISCGEIVPEGRWVCQNCEKKAKEKNDAKE